MFAPGQISDDNGFVPLGVGIGRSDSRGEAPTLLLGGALRGQHLRR